MRRALACLLVLLASTAQAQVFRCVQDGKTTYSDTPCASSQGGHQVERRKSQQEISQEREQAYAAEMLKQQRRMGEQQRKMAEQQQRAMQPMPAPVVRHSGNDWQIRNDLRNAEISAKYSTTNNNGKRDRNQQRRRIAVPMDADPAPSFPKTIERCSGQYCYDRDGQSYHSIGNSQIRSNDGTTCFMSGGQYLCR